MLNFFKAFVVFLIWTTIALTTHYFVTHKTFDNCKLNSEEINSELNRTPQNYFLVINERDTIYKSLNGISIYRNENKINIPKDLLEKLSVFISNNYTKKLEITTYHSSDENNDIGNLRNQSISNTFVKNGIPLERLKTESVIKNIAFNADNLNNNGASIVVTNRSNKEIDSINNSIISKRLYLDIIDNEIQNTEELTSYIDLLKQYLELHPTKTIHITGHTDNRGYFQNNLTKGMLKSNSLKNYFIEQGIDNSQIKTYSRGEAEPIANKYTEEGKKLNNRIEININ